MGVAHLTVTNICVWFKFILEETFESIKENPKPTENSQNYNSTKNIRLSNLTSFLYKQGDEQYEYPTSTAEGLLFTPKAIKETSQVCEQVTNHVSEIIVKLNPFLHPCTIEYSIICVTLFYIIWNNIGRQNIDSESSSNGAMKTMRRYSEVAAQTQIFYVDCNKTMKGLFAGILTSILTIIVLIVFVVSGGGNLAEQNPSENSFKLFTFYLTEGLELFLLIVLFMVTVSGFLAIKKMETSPEYLKFTISMDEVLQIFSLFGVLSFGFFRILAFRFSPVKNVYAFLLLANGIISFAQGTLQTLLILEGLKKHCAIGSETKKKKGREQVTFLIMVNLSLWLLYSMTRNKYANVLFKDPISSIEYLAASPQKHYANFSNAKIAREVGQLSSSSTSSENAQAIKWIMINTIIYPLLLYFHFHSSCCLSNMWKICYS